MQFAPAFGAKEKNLERVGVLLRRTEQALLVLPELFTTGYAFRSKQEVRRLAEPADGPTSRFLTRLCRERGLAIVAGFAERAGGRLYNSAMYVTAQGVGGIYRKAHLFMYEKRWFEPGNTHFRPFAFGKTRIGVLICWDWIYPEAMRTLAANGAEMICHCANLVLPYCQAAMVTRSIENRVFIITANRTGREKRGTFEFRFTGGSQIVGPGGRVLARVGGRREAVRCVNINPREARNKKVTRLNDLFGERRTDLYFRG